MADKMQKGRHRGARGERCKNHKLKTEQVLKIRELYASGNILQKELALMFGVNRVQITRIVNKTRWGHIP
jgi:DNA invertase Pin-like site-specific DNA recombinase